MKNDEYKIMLKKYWQFSKKLKLKGEENVMLIG